MKKIVIIAVLMFSSILKSAENIKLPDLGTPAEEAMSLGQEADYRNDILQQMHQYHFLMTDPIVASYMYHLGYRLASNSGNPERQFYFFMVPYNIINAAAYPGGLVVIYSGLFLETDNESELAGVVSHEIAHVNQRHIARRFAKQKKNAIPMMLGMLAAMAAATASDSRDAPIAVLASMTALQQQMSINFTRHNEYEADRVGINTLHASGFDPLGMASFFAKLMKNNQLDDKYKLPEYLRTHPLSVNRVTEAKNRSKNLAKKQVRESVLYDYVKERVRVLVSDEFEDLSSYYIGKLNEKGVKKGPLRYGYSLFLIKDNKPEKALGQLLEINVLPETEVLINVSKVEIFSMTDWQKADNLLTNLIRTYPENRAVLETAVELYLQRKDLTTINKAVKHARKLVLLDDVNPRYLDLLAIAYYNALKPVKSGEIQAKKEHILGRNYRAARILRNLMKEELNYYQRSKITAMVAKYEALITEKERRAEKVADGGH